MLNPTQAACEEAIALLTRPKGSYHIQAVSSLEQLQQLWEIDKAAYQDCSLEFEEFAHWWRLYEFGSRILLEGDRILASIGIYPLSPEQADAFRSGQICEGELEPVLLSQCEQEPQQNWYASGIVVREELRGWNSPLKSLLKLGLSFWIDSGHIRFPLTINAIAEYDIGARLLDYFDFQKIRDGSTLPDGCDLYQAEFASESAFRSFLKAKGL